MRNEKCSKILNKLIQLPKKELEELRNELNIKMTPFGVLELIAKEINKNIDSSSYVDNLERINLIHMIEEDNGIIDFILNLKEKEENWKYQKKECNKEIQRQKDYIENLKKKLKEKEEIIKYFEEKQNDLDSFIQEKISQNLKKYEEKIKKLEQENKELKEQLGFYE